MMNYESLSYEDKVNLYMRLLEDGVASPKRAPKQGVVQAIFFNIVGTKCDKDLIYKITDMADYLTVNYQLHGVALKKGRDIPDDLIGTYKEVCRQIVNAIHPYIKDAQDKYEKYTEEIDLKFERLRCKDCLYSKPEASFLCYYSKTRRENVTPNTIICGSFEEKYENEE